MLYFPLYFHLLLLMELMIVRAHRSENFVGGRGYRELDCIWNNLHKLLQFITRFQMDIESAPHFQLSSSAFRNNLVSKGIVSSFVRHVFHSLSQGRPS